MFIKAIIFSFFLIFLLTSCYSKHEKNIFPVFSKEATYIEEATTSAEYSTIIVTEKASVNQENIIYHLDTMPDSREELYIHAITGFESDEEHITIKSVLDGYYSAWPTTGKVHLLLLSDNIVIPNAKTLTISNGFQYISFEEASEGLSCIEILELPNTVHYLKGNHHSKTVNDNFSGSFPLELGMLKEIHVASDSEYFNSISGVLYEIKPRNIHDSYMQRLAVIPQNYSTDSQTFCLANGTDEIATGAIYHCRNIQKVVIPDSVVKIGDHAIIATAEHPLTVVCSRGSAAAAYVAEFGEQYHLTVEYTD
jgi:hypothetical protein